MLSIGDHIVLICIAIQAPAVLGASSQGVAQSLDQ